MSQKMKKKLCWNCEGNVSKKETNCPYCGVYLHPTDDHEDDEEELEIDPPYTPNRYNNELTEEKEENFTFLKAPYTLKESSFPTQEKKETEEEVPYETKNEILRVLIPLSLLLFGSILLLFAVMLFLFSHHGVLEFHWDASYWSFYLIGALPLLYFGWRYLDLSLETKKHV